MSKAIHFGAGKIGRGFIGSVLNEAGYEVTFADINQEIIDLINKEKGYAVCGNQKARSRIRSCRNLLQHKRHHRSESSNVSGTGIRNIENTIK